MHARPLFDDDLKNKLRDLLRLMKLTNEDVGFAGDIYKPRVTTVNSGQPVEFWEVFTSAKPLVRALMGQLDALSHLMRQIIVERAAYGLPTLSNKELATLSGRKYDRKSDTVLGEPARYLPTIDSFRLAVRHFPSVFGYDSIVDFREVGWNSVVQLAMARNRFTHPKRLHDLVPIEALVHLQPALLWTQDVLMNLTRLLLEAAGGSSMPAPPTHQIRAVQTRGLRRPEEILDDEFHAQVRSSGSKSIRYVTDMMKRLHDDTTFAWDLYSRRIKAINPRDFVDRPLHSDEYLQFAARNLLRAFFSQVEGTISFTRFLLEAASDRGEIELGEEERVGFASGTLEQQLLWTSSAWSREFGTGEVIDQSSADWRSFVEAIAWRNGVTHPQELFDFVLIPGRIEKILRLPSWFFSHPMRVLTLVPEKFLR
jgi:hypothetical protein